jgi:hypothetical protein
MVVSGMVVQLSRAFGSTFCKDWAQAKTAEYPIQSLTHMTSPHLSCFAYVIVEFAGLGKSHGHYTDIELNVKLTHMEPKDYIDTLAFNAVKAVRYLFDAATGWRSDNITINNILNRTIYLETIAAVPGMVAAIIRHFRSLRTMKPDGGYLQLFLEEANNERYDIT